MKERIIMGVDPGTAVMGYGIILEQGSQLQLLSMGVVKMTHLDDHFLKLQRIFEKTMALVKEFKPDVMAIEAPFYSKNPQVLLKLGRAQGIAISTALSQNIPAVEYSPRKIKQAITGNGNSSKEQVAAMLQRLLKFTETPSFLDATDGLAVAVCHAFQKVGVGQSSQKSYGSWSSFVTQNQDRLKKK